MRSGGAWPGYLPAVGIALVAITWPRACERGVDVATYDCASRPTERTVPPPRLSCRCSRAFTSACCAAGGGVYCSANRRWRSRCITRAASVRRSRPAPASRPAAPHCAWLAVSCPRGSERMIEAALRDAYPNCRLRAVDQSVGPPAVVLRLKKRAEFIKRVKALDHFEHEREPPVNGLITTMGACGVGVRSIGHHADACVLRSAREAPV